MSENSFEDPKPSRGSFVEFPCMGISDGQTALVITPTPDAHVATGPWAPKAPPTKGGPCGPWLQPQPQY